MIQDLQQIFGREPPVYAKPTGSAASPQVQRTSSPASPSTFSSSQAAGTSNSDPRERGPPAPPILNHQRQGSSSNSIAAPGSPASNSTAGPPAPPPKPGQASRQSSLDPNPRSFTPPHQGSHFAQSPTHQHQPTYSQPNGHAYNPSNASPLHHQQHFQQPHQQPAQYQYHQAPPTAQFHLDQSSRVASPHAGPTRSGSLDPQARFASPISPSTDRSPSTSSWTQGPQQQSYNQQAQSQSSQAPQQALPPPLPPQPIRQQDFLDSIEPTPSTNDQFSNVPAPPRPLNPELLALHTALNDKITSRLNSLHSTLSTANSQLEILQSDLKRGEPAIRDEMKRLEAVRDVCRTRRGRLEDLNRKGEERFQMLKGKEEPDMEGIACATSIVGNQ